jgi:two-component system sensor histidine kinase ChvG
MLSIILKNLSILKKFLLINLIIFIIIGSGTIIYLKTVKPNLIKKKTVNHIKIINNTIDHIQRLNIKFKEDDIRRFLFSTRFLFQNLDRVLLFDNKFILIGDTDSLDLDPRSFSKTLNIVEEEISEEKKKITSTKMVEQQKKNKIFLKKVLIDYSSSKNFGIPYSYTEETYNQFLLTTIKNVNFDGKNIGYLAISENANEIRTAINERKSFIIRTAFVVAIVILIFSIVLNRYFLKPIKNLVNYTKIIKEKSKKKSNIEILKKRNDEIGALSKSLDDMTNDLYKRINIAENFSTDLVHEIRNPLASLKSASEIISETEDKDKREKLVKILSHDVERIERLITDYSQMLKDEVALSTEKMNKIDLILIVQSVVDDFNNIYIEKRGIKIELITNNSKKDFNILGIENRIEQILANLLDNAISFSKDKQKIIVEVEKNQNDQVILRVIDQGQGFKEKKLNKIFDRFYSNRPDKFGEHSGLGLNIVKNLVELHSGIIDASNNTDQGGARIEIAFPKV